MTTEKRLPKIGDVYCEACGIRWAALQIVYVNEDQNVLIFLDLDWYSEQKLTAEKLDSILPLTINRFRMENELSISTVSFENMLQTELPSDLYHFIGNKALLDGIDISTNGFQSEITWRNLKGEDHGQQLEWPHSNAAMEAWWREFPESDRTNYKKCYQLNEDISILGQELNSRDSDIFIPENAIEDWSILNNLGCLRSIKCEGRQDGLMEYLKTRSLIESLNWKKCAHESIDLRNSRINWLSNITIGGSELKEIIVDSGMTSLHLTEKLHPELKICDDAKGKELSLGFSNNLVDGIIPDFNLPELQDLTVYSARIDAASIVQAYPNLESLDLRGELGIIENMAELGKLKGLKRLMLFDLFGYNSDEFPVRSQWSMLEYIFIQTYPADLAKKLKKEFSDCNDYFVRMPKKPEWIAENLDNPFRDWEGREIANGKIKKAVAAYKKTNAAIRELKKPAERTKLVSALEEFTESMNKVSDIIDTIEREEVVEIYLEFLSKADVLNEKDAYLRLFDEWRDF